MNEILPDLNFANSEALSEHWNYDCPHEEGPENSTIHFDAWQHYMSSSDSPQIYIDFGWYFTVAAALQRRVWTGSAERPLYPNLYVLLIGPPGIGKGLVLTSIKDILRHHKMPGEVIDTPTGKEPVPLIPVAADTTTFESLLADMSKSVRFLRHTDPTTKKATVYSHISYSILLEELNSLIKLKAADISKLLLRLYDANDYDYRLKNGSSAILRRVCVCLIAGATVNFLEEAEKMRLFDDGFTARSIMLFGRERRINRFDLGSFEDSQLEAKAKLCAWIGRLQTLYGEVKIPPHVEEFLQHWFETTFVAEEREAHPKMVPYYGRKRAHLKKLAMAIHFSESLDMELTMHDVTRALKFLDVAERNMKLGLLAAGRNALHSIATRVVQYVFRRKAVVTEVELLQQFGVEVRHAELQEILTTLQVSQYLVRQGEGYVTTALAYGRFLGDQKRS